MSNPLAISTEGVDDLPLLLAQLHKMQLADLIDKHFPTHGNWRGLSLGQTTCVWLSHILSQGNHYLVKVQPWAKQLLQTLQACLGQSVRELDFSDDRLACVLDNLAKAGQWQDFELELSRQLVRVYALEVERVRIDSTTTYQYGSVTPEGLFQFGHSKDHRPDLPQLKVNLATLDPLGLPISTTIVSGNTADDGLYLPEIKRVQATVEHKGLLFVADCKMGAVAVRSYLHKSGDFYLLPLSQVQLGAPKLDELLAPVLSGQQTTSEIYQSNAAGERVLVARGYEHIRTVRGEVDEQPLSWSERLLVVHSLQLVQAQTRSLHKRLTQAQEALVALQPSKPKRGRKRYHNAAELQSLAEGIIANWEVQGLVQVTVTETSPTDLQLVVSVDTQAVAQAISRLGWRVYATNQKAEILSLEMAVGAYRSEYLIEHNFGRLKGRQLSVQPLQVMSDERVVGLLRLLSIGLRVFGLLEYQVRQQLSEQKAQLAGLYDGNPKRSTAQPTSEGLLKAFKGINLTTISGISDTNACQHHITVLSGLQERILALLELPLNLYSGLSLILDELPSQMSEP